ncbi:MAG TPA: 16S rRNA (guanine(527)-N(7))-methyltransferase RsmG [Burkholderiales bacterium]|jgi:16S rRNA (guanine527-N7)-methyltransferase|nr:16S rRNA (guanine(527)-N(7))-methyltransferase RsmG [Burkholderiales bacterium]
MSGAHELDRELAAPGVELSEAQAATLDRYLDLLEKWNRVYNLTAIRERSRMVTHHLLDSLAVLPHLRGPSVLDVGSGAGLPGIPIAVASPSLRVTLLESSHKKSAFLTQAVGELRLANVAVVTERVEAWQTEQRFDTIVSRAFADLGEFVTLSGRLLAPDGVLAAMKGVHPFEEVERLPEGFRVEQVIPLHVPGLDAERHLVLVRRMGTA